MIRHAPTCKGYYDRAAVVNDFLITCQIKDQMPPAFTEKGRQLALEYAKKLNLDVWVGILEEYHEEGDQFLEACDCGAYETTNDEPSMGYNPGDDQSYTADKDKAKAEGYDWS